MIYRLLFRTVFARMDPEAAHRLGFAVIRLVGAVPGVRHLVARLFAPPAGPPVSALGLQFPNPLGLAAGFDKDARGPRALAMLGFGFIEVGTVTARAQPGNPRPRLFRLTADRALVNRMGFNNDGAAAAAERLRRLRAAERRPGRRGAGRRPGETHGGRRLLIGVNIGKTKAVPDEAAIDDYTTSATLLGPLADYLVVNVSSPNTPGLRDLQSVDRLRPLLVAVRTALDAASPQRRVPLLVKIAPDLADPDVDAVADLALELQVDGVIATNTTIARPDLATPEDQVVSIGTGGLSGAPLKPRALEVLRRLRERCGPELTLIAAGGIETPADAAERLAAGADLLQGYTAFVYGGPGWPRRIVAGLRR